MSGDVNPLKWMPNDEACVACDVFVLLPKADTPSRQSIASILDQHNVRVKVHLIGLADNFPTLSTWFDDSSNIRFCPLDVGQCPWRRAHTLAAEIDSEYIALQHASALSDPGRIAALIGALKSHGACLAGSRMTVYGRQLQSVQPSPSYGHSIPWPTLVMRRDAFIDLGGFAQRVGDTDVEFIHRACASGRQIAILDDPLVELTTEWTEPELSAAPEYNEQFGSLRQHGMGFPSQPVDCDVVLPFHGQLEYVTDSIQSVIDQDDASTIIHLIDDKSPESTHELFRYWGTHPRVRLYRNQQNIGQFMSFNNVARFLETDLVAVQDGDDVSLPHRIRSSGNMLRLCGADFYAAAMDQFGEEEIAERYRVRRSFPPPNLQHLYFAMNPTACFRVELFRRLHGYADFGSLARNCTGLDSEFMIRALFSQTRFAFSTEIVALHRLHHQSATRRSDTGFGSPARDFALAECHRRLNQFQAEPFDPAKYGAMDRFAGVTERV